jgi:hypothetical protein
MAHTSPNRTVKEAFVDGIDAFFLQINTEAI